MKKDIYTNNLIECADVFADIANVNLLSEQMQIHDFELEDMKADFSYRELDGEPRKLFRDTFKKDNQKLIHVEQTLDMLSAFSGDNRFKEIKSYYENMNDEEKGERNTMCILLDAVEEEGVKKGIERGIEQVTMTMIQKQISDNEIISLTGITEEKLAALKKQIGI